MDVVLSVLGSLAGAYLLLALTPWGERLRFWSVRRFGGTGVAVHVELDPAHVQPQGDDDLTPLLFAQDFHLDALDPSALPDPPSDGRHPAAWWAWGHRLGGKDVRRTSVLVTIQALTDAAVVVDPPRVVHRYTPSTAGVTLATAGWGRGGGVVPRRVVVTLDEDAAQVRSVDPLDRPRSFTLARHESERLLVTVDVRGTGRYDWSVELPLVVDGRREVLRIDDHGTPFTTYGWETGQVYMWSGERGWWAQVTCPACGGTAWREERDGQVRPHAAPRGSRCADSTG